MAENLVSKFTINSQGTDIDVKIKDEDARNLIAQEISDRDSAVTTITNNLNKEISDRESADTTITNNLNKEISDRSALISKDSEGNTVVTSTNGALYINTKNPIKYGLPQNHNNYFNYLPITDKNNNTYNVLVAGSNIDSLGALIGTVVFVGDSYGIGTGATLETGLAYKIAEKLNKTVGTNFFNYSQGGAGFGAETSFKTMIDNNTAPNPENVTTLIIAGGRNDTDFPSNIDTAMTDCINAAKTKYTNATIYIVYDCASKDYLQSRVKTLFNYATNAYKNGCAFIDVSTLCKTVENCITDLYHPNAKGYDILAGGIVSVILGGNKVEAPAQYINITNNAGLNMYLVATDTLSQIGIIGNSTINARAESNGLVNNYLVHEYTYNVSDRANTLSGNNEEFIALYGNCIFNFDELSTFYTAAYRLVFSENKMKLYLTALTQWPTVSTGQTIHIYMSANITSFPGYFL